MALIGFPLLQEGDKDVEGNNVKKVQYLLNGRGANVTVDGIFGPDTDDAVELFQKANNLAVDGDVGDDTWNALIMQLQNGSTGKAVLAVQTQFTTVADDGIFGAQTATAVKEFQTHSSLTADGIVGPLTWRALTNAPIQTPGSSG